MDKFHSVLDFWFEGTPQHNVKHRWFLSNGSDAQLEFDKLVTEKFSDTLELALRGEFDELAKQTARDALALIIIVDQFSRHIYRSNPQALQQCDEKATNLTKQSLKVSKLVFLKKKKEKKKKKKKHLLSSVLF